MMISVSFSFSFLVLSFPLCLILFFSLFLPSLVAFLCIKLVVIFNPLFRVYECTTATRYIPGVIALQVIRDGIPQVVIIPLPSCAGTAAVHVLFCLFSSIETFIVACFVSMG